ncbi:MAG TPA: RsmB/NOP family class I SAM-dependent RNA methyltransferase, partial [Rhizomicrobium sp.]|nr:RsmB/NOP family class I SAM-dependent RNA methyltransferase [Rhizomicrobium sp.]
MGSDNPRALAIASLLSDGKNPKIFFTGGYGPAPLSDAEHAAIAATPGQEPLPVKGEYPGWLDEELRRSFGEKLLAEMEAFQVRAPVDLRVNALKAARDQVMARLHADGIEALALPGLPDAIRCRPGAALTAHSLYAAGAFEVQDKAAQEAVMLCAAKPGMRVLDLAAGAGGKSLALAAAMENRGEIVACDVRQDALAELSRRAVRAGTAIIRPHHLGPLPDGPFDLVLVDAPCSGSGTWRRQPELKWRLTPERLAQLQDAQDHLLRQAASVAPERLVYATCSILPCENQDRADAFLSAHEEFQRLQSDFHASPGATGSDGFYAALLGRANF